MVLDGRATFNSWLAFQPPSWFWANFYLKMAETMELTHWKAQNKVGFPFYRFRIPSVFLEWIPRACPVSTTNVWAHYVWYPGFNPLQINARSLFHGNHLLPQSHTRILGTLSSSSTKSIEKPSVSVYVRRSGRVFQAPTWVSSSSSRRETAGSWAELT